MKSIIEDVEISKPTIEAPVFGTSKQSAMLIGSQHECLKAIAGLAHGAPTQETLDDILKVANHGIAMRGDQ